MYGTFVEQQEFPRKEPAKNLTSWRFNTRISLDQIDQEINVDHRLGKQLLSDPYKVNIDAKCGACLRRNEINAQYLHHHTWRVAHP